MNVDAKLRKLNDEPSAAANDLLPAEILETIFRQLDTGELFQLQRVCRRWQQAARATLAQRTELVLGNVLKRVQPNGWKTLSERELEYVLELMPRLTKLNCQWPVCDLKHMRLEKMGSLCGQLTSIYFNKGTFDRDAALRLLQDCGHRLDTLEFHDDLDYWTDSTPRVQVEDMLPLLSALRRLELPKHQLTGAEVRLLPASLHTLRVEKIQRSVTASELTTLARCTQLRHLNMGDGYALDGNQLNDIIRPLTSLERLVVTELDDSLEDLPLEKIAHLQHLSLDDSVLNDESVQRLPQLAPRLKSLSLWGCYQVSDVGISALAGLKELDALNVDLALEEVGNVTETSLNALSILPLRQLFLGKTHLPFSYLKLLPLNFSSLEILSVYDNNSSEEGTGERDWSQVADLLPSERDVIIITDYDNPIRLRRWAEGSTQDVQEEVRRAVRTGRFENWFAVDA